jgi:hypothetical protein
LQQGDDVGYRKKRENRRVLPRRGEGEKRALNSHFDEYRGDLSHQLPPRVRSEKKSRVGVSSFSSPHSEAFDHFIHYVFSFLLGVLTVTVVILAVYLVRNRFFIMKNLTKMRGNTDVDE